MIISAERQWCNTCIKLSTCPMAGIPITITKEQSCWTNGLQVAEHTTPSETNQVNAYHVDFEILTSLD